MHVDQKLSLGIFLLFSTLFGDSLSLNPEHAKPQGSACLHDPVLGLWLQVLLCP